MSASDEPYKRSCGVVEAPVTPSAVGGKPPTALSVLLHPNSLPHRTASAFGGLPPTADGECRARRHAKRRVAQPWLTPQSVVFSLYSSFAYVHNQCGRRLGVKGRAVRLAVYCQPQMVNARRGDAPKGASPSLG